MGFLKSLGTFAGEVTGKVIGGSVRVVGELTNSQTIKEIGDGAERATAKTGQLLGKVASGAVDVGIGLIQKDESKMDQGFSDLGEAAVTTAKDVGRGIGYLYHNGKDVVTGIKDGDLESVKSAAKNIGMVAAVGVLAIGVIDIIDGADGVANAAEAEADVPVDAAPIDTINADLAGTEHPETGVPYEVRTIQLPDGQWVEGVFPDFDEVEAFYLPESMYLQSDDVQFSYLNEQLAQEAANDPGFASQFTSEQLAQIQQGDTPDGYVWHHAEEPGRMELVGEEEHMNSAHTGGRELWGGGSAYR